jgi:hypothetical protein
VTHTQRNEAVLRALQKYTQKAIASKTEATKAMVATGLYTAKGELKVKFGGTRKKVG